MGARIDELVQFVDTNGKPFVGGFIYIGENGLDPELNPISIYSDRELTVEISNPQTLDSYGRSTNKIWFDGKYSMKIEDEDNAQVLEDLDAGTIAEVGNTTLTDVLGADTITANATNTITEYVDGQTYIFTAVSNNTGAVTLNIDSLGAKPIQKNYTEDLVADDIVATYEVVVIYNSENDIFQMVIQKTNDLYPEDYIIGGEITLSPGTTTTVEIASGIALDSAGEFNLDLTAFTKDMNVEWEEGTGNGGLLSGTELTAFSSYDVYALLLDSDETTIDYGCDLPANGTDNLPTGYSNYRLLGRFFTNGDIGEDEDEVEILKAMNLTNNEGYSPGYLDGGVMSLGETSVDIEEVSSAGGNAVFEFTPGPTLSSGDVVKPAGFVTNTDYNGTRFCTTVGTGTFETGVSFGSDETGTFTYQTPESILVTDISARDDNNTADIIGPSKTKLITATWVEGNNVGGLFTGTLAVDTVYYFFAIVRDSDGVVDYGYDTDADAANIPTGYTAYKMLSRLLTDSSGNIIDSMQGRFLSEAQTVSNAGVLDIAHGLDTPEILVEPSLLMIAAVTNLDEGMEIVINPGQSGNSASDGGALLTKTYEDISVVFDGAATVFKVIGTTGSGVSIPNEDCLYRIRLKEIA